MQHRVVVFVHPGHLGRAEAVRLSSQAAAHQTRAARGQGECDHCGAEGEREARIGELVHGLDLDADGHQAGDRAVAAFHGHHRVDREAPAGGDRARDGLALQRLLVRAEDVLADQRDVGMGVADAIGPGHDDVLHVRAAPDLLGPGLQDDGGIPAVQGGRDSGRVGEGLRHAQGPGPRLVHAVPSALDHQGDDGRHDEQRHDAQHEDEDLAGHGVDAEQGAQPADR